MRAGGLDPKVALFRSTSQGGATGSALRTNDNNREAPGTRDSLLSYHVSRGFYLIEAKLKYPDTVNGNRTVVLTIESNELIPRRDDFHQPDHTVAYIIEAIPAESYLAPMVPTAVATAVSEWNRVGGGPTSFWPYAWACKDGECNNLNSNGAMTVKVVGKSGCKKAHACAVGLSEVLIESPAYGEDTKKDYLWTLDSNLHGTTIKGDKGKVYTRVYLPTTMVHEFGHIFGLDDLALLEYGDRYINYIMGARGGGQVSTIPALDAEYLKQVYRQYDYK